MLPDWVDCMGYKMVGVKNFSPLRFVGKYRKNINS